MTDTGLPKIYGQKLKKKFQLAIGNDTIVVMNYREYIKSEAWRKRRFWYFETHDKKCRKCNSVHRIQLHHKTYKRLGGERDADLVALCYQCHKKLHKMQKESGQNLWSATEDFLRKRKRKTKSGRPVRRQSRLLKKNTRS